MSSRDYLSQLNHQIITAIASAIKEDEPLDEIQDMVVNTSTYKQAMCSWTDPETGLGLLQTAIVNKRLDVVKFLLEKFTNSYFPFQDYQCEGSNPPLHLACKVGAVGIVEYLVDTFGVSITKNALVTFPNVSSSVVYDNCKSGMIYPRGGELDLDMEGQEGSSMSSTSSDGCIQSLTPFEICISEGHVECAQCLCDAAIQQTPGNLLPPIHSSSVLHKACCLASPEYLQLLIDSGYQSFINDADDYGHTPLLLACRVGDTRCIKVLLERGADISTTVEGRTCLHTLFWCIYKRNVIYDTTKLLIQSGVDINTVDGHNNTALDYLAWEYGESTKTVRPLPESKFATSVCFEMCEKRIRKNLNDVEFREEVYLTMELLLAYGAETQVEVHSGIVDHSILHTLLQSTGWPLNKALRKVPQNIYKILQLFFKHGANPNVEARNSNESAFTMLIMHSLHEVPQENLKLDFVHLFLQNGVNPDKMLAEPRQYSYWTNKWDYFNPLVVAVYEKHPISVIELLYNFSSLDGVQKSLAMLQSQPWILHHYRGNSEAETRMEFLLKPHVWSLRHFCKHVIIKSLGKSLLVEKTPLPKALKEYILAMEC